MTTNELLALNVNKHVEKKNGLSYLSWAWAWDQALRADPTANFNVSTWTKDDGTTQCYMEINGTAMVWVSVTMLGHTRTCMLPVMDHRNKPIQSPDAFQVNTAIMRCMTKCLALFGLGLYIYAGEDLPLENEVPQAEEEQSENPTEEQKVFAEGMLQFVNLNKDVKSLKSYWKANLTQLDKLKESAPALYEKVRAVFTAKREEMEKADA